MQLGKIAMLAALTGLAMTASADTLETPSQPADSVGPHSGLNMARVEAAYGAPARRVEPVGQPPISRWEYPGFIVYFEHDKVIHTVALK
jgi:hypothetical protein